ncbi:hypothetical protein ACSU1N_06705 [Thermogladius sp. 4427co]|uniref:hypothetical protein n=1 Tax=Thermogladius sp. 4427co TaxID=3450718 RepID=UPI003F79EDBB
MLHRIILVAIGIALAGFIAFASITNIFVVNIRGVVNVPRQIFEKSIEIEINASSGSRTIDLGTVTIPGDGYFKIEAQGSILDKGFRIVVNGVLRLEPVYKPLTGNSSINISMPCLLVVNTTCYRVMVIIPGYDTPLRIPGGEYRASLDIAWGEAEGTGSFQLVIKGLYSENPF